VVGIDLKTKTDYACEVAVDLTTGLQYTNGNRPNKVEKIAEKFSKDIEHMNK